jgi:hypothetical protein
MNRRELIVSGPVGDPRVFEQLQALRADPDGARERDLEVLEREALSFRVELHGKDGGLKARWEDPDGARERAADQPTRTL